MSARTTPTAGIEGGAGHTADAFAALLSPARPRMFLVALAIVADRTEAEDVLQDATITGLNKFRAGEFATGTNFDAWMGQITRFTALNARRTRHSAPPALGDASERLSAGHNGSVNGRRAQRGEDYDADDARALRLALDGLSETARLCLLLRVVGGLPYSSISAIVQVPEGTAMSHVHRAQRALRQTLSGRASNAPGVDERQGGTR
ncbi:MAG TPA: RNA polymerase sigma factor [Phycisphaerales bacterium]|nr:RNA polymerase sigma factor [Phycisphaerales bacterium]